ncbi:MAG: hypothetical protein K2X11_07365 [Acetobacteraceae bacterium]|nr:hypothetical protein [Acetobacteraceae bacterium]
MDEATAETLAKLAGLEKAWANHRADVLDALRTWERNRAALPRLAAPQAEPARVEPTRAGGPA